MTVTLLFSIITNIYSICNLSTHHASLFLSLVWYPLIYECKDGTFVSFLVCKHVYYFYFKLPISYVQLERILLIENSFCLQDQ
jgi:hypothetical protein